MQQAMPQEENRRGINNSLGEVWQQWEWWDVSL